MEKLILCLEQSYLITLFYKLLPTFVTAALAIIGWLVIYGNAKKLASRNEAHSLVQKVDDRLLDILQYSKDYWSYLECEDDRVLLESKRFSVELGGSISLIRSYLKLIEDNSSMSLEFKPSKELMMLKKKCELDSECVLDMELNIREKRAIDVVVSITYFRSQLYSSFRNSFPN